MIRSTVAHVDLSALKENFRAIQSFLGATPVAPSPSQPAPSIIAVVKANAYGHGATAVAGALEQAGATMLACADIEEGIVLRRGGATVPILIFGALSVSDLDGLFEFSLTPTISTPGAARAVQAAAARRGKALGYHLKIDTGMNRLGFRHDNLRRTLPELFASDNLRLEGVYTHFASADVPESALLDEQRVRYEHALTVVDELLRTSPPASRTSAAHTAPHTSAADTAPRTSAAHTAPHTSAADTAPRTSTPHAAPRTSHPYVRHAANSAALLRDGRCWFDAVRPGLLLYGIVPPPLASTLPLRPAMTLTSRVVAVKGLRPGEGVGYGWRYRTEEPRRIAVVPAGYADGLDTRLCGRGQVLIRGTRAPIVGAVSMDMLTVDVTGVDAVQPGDEVVLLGRQGDESWQQIDAREVAAAIGTIPWEVVCRLGSRVERLYIANG